MPTRTVRLALPTFLEKLSKHNEFRKRKTHVYYDDFFANSFPFIKAYDKNLSIADKKEWLAAMGWLAHHGKKVDAYVNLSDEAIQLLLNMFQVTVELSERADKVAHLVQLTTEAHPGSEELELSADSSGTDAEPTRRRGSRPRRSTKQRREDDADRAAGRRPPRARSSARSTKTRAEPIADRADEEEESEEEDDEDESESFSSASDTSTSRRDGEGRQRPRPSRRDHRRREDGDDEGVQAVDPEERTPRRSPSAGRRTADGVAGDRGRAHRPADRAAARMHDPGASARRARFADEAEPEAHPERDDRRRNPERREGGERRDDARPHSGARVAPWSVPQWQPEPVDTDEDGSRRSDDLSDSEDEATERRTTSGRSTTPRSAPPRSPPSPRADQHGDIRAASRLTPQEKDEVARFQRRQSRRQDRRRDRHGSDSDRDEDLTPTRFGAMVRAEAAQLIAQCGCALCKVYGKIQTASAKHIMRGAEANFTRFRRPLESTRRDDLREWAAMLFWCLHPIKGSSWSTMPRKERQYVAECLLTPRSWNNEQRLTYASTTVKLLREETTTLMRYKAKYDDGSTGGIAADEPRVTPTRAALKNAFLLKLRSLEFNPLEWLDSTESKELLSMRKIMTVGGTTTAPSTLIPYASAPWLQSLSWHATRPMNFVQAGRMLSVALRTHSDAFTAQLEQLARSHRTIEDERLFSAVDAAARDRDLGRLLTCTTTARQFASDILDGAHTSASEWHQQFAMAESKTVLEGRTRQKAELPTFFQAIQKSVEAGCSTQSSKEQRDTYTRGAWLGFFEGLRAGRLSAELVKSTMKRGRSLTSSGRQGSSSEKSGLSSSDSDGYSGGRARRRQKKKRERRDSASPQADGDGKSGARGKVSGAKCLFQVHFPSSVSILGPRLGVECSASGPCRICKKPGHWSGECPQHWATHHMCFPGYRPSGKRTVGKWDDDKNPLKETAREWVRFLQDKHNDPAGGVPALEPNAPSLAAFRAWVGKAAA
jgi:hypothetical protein